MIDGATLAPVTKPPPGNDRWRRWWLIIFVLVLIASTGFALGRGLDASAPRPAPSPVPTAAPVLEEATTPPPPPAPPAPTPTPSPETTLLRLPGAVPAHGSGSFRYASRRGQVLGTKGPVRHFSVAVEKGSDENPEEFAEQVEATLGDPRSWIGGGRFRLQLVAGADVADFTVFLATRDTAGQMCERGGTNIRIGGRPYTSCRTPGRAIVNLDRWRLSAAPFVAAAVPLATYRQYVINHEVGHQFGHHHQGCPKAGGPAPVMVQQTLTVRGCTPYAWPRRGNGFFTGPSL